MQIKIDIQGLDDVQRMVGNAAKQAKYALAVALTRTAREAEKQLQKDMVGTFDNPTPWIAKGTFTKSATKQTLTAVVGIKDRQTLYVKEHFDAGQRGQKPYERVLQSLGVLPAGYRTVPGSGLKLDSRGNPSRSQLKEILGSVKTRMAIAKGRGKRVALVGYFAVLPGAKTHLSPGIYWRSARAIRPVLIFVQAATYRKTLDLVKMAERVVAEKLPGEFSTAFDQAMETAR